MNRVNTNLHSASIPLDNRLWYTASQTYIPLPSWSLSTTIQSQWYAPHSTA